ncbi:MULTISPECIES: hypothetical protein [Providencia]|uniref:hypothetical protein n=2 Tax=Morganellaceae TaxID=1903414 RepID=UPI0012B51AD7|nr:MULTISPECIES: hypothetical protein [unclassified Providencia]MTB41651.1 hypothetical protein [Providencia sp. wls1949]MTC09571.1 hypothetical protein [Providencia sp. wls1948]
MNLMLRLSGKGVLEKIKHLSANDEITESPQNTCRLDIEKAVSIEAESVNFLAIIVY